MKSKLPFICVLVMAGCVATTAQGRTDIPLMWNQPADRSTCPVATGAVWAEYDSGEDCIRYFAAGKVENAPAAIIYFRGDRDRAARRNPKDIRNNTAKAQQAVADRMAKKAGLPVIVVERPGTFGSSGSHFDRRRAREFLALNAALDEIRDRYHIGQFVVYGHSGGATAGAALLTMGRTDISCAVLTSGAYSLLERAQMLEKRSGKKQHDQRNYEKYGDVYDPLDHLEGIVHDPKRRIFVIGNEKDSVTPFVLQKKFADRVSQAGHDVRLVNHAATAPKFHHLKDSIGLTTAARCARNEQ